MVAAYWKAVGTGEVSFSEIGSAFELTGQRVSQILKERGIEAVSTARRGPKSFSTCPLSSGHRVLGQRLLNWMAEQEPAMTTRGFSLLSGLGLKTVASLERGVHNVTYLELMQMARAMGITVSELVKEPQ